MLRSVVVGFFLLLVVVSSALAQNSRFELTGTVGGAQAPVVLNPPSYIPRTPPSYVESDQMHNLLFAGIDGRVYWAKRLSAVAQVSWGNNPSATFTFQKPSQPTPPFTTYPVEQTVERRTWMLSILQSVDLVAEGRLRPWVAGGFAFVHAADSYQHVDVAFADPSARSQSTQDLDRSGSAAVFAGGIRVFVTKSVFVSGDESWRGFFSDQPLGSFNAMWRVGIGISY